MPKRNKVAELSRSYGGSFVRITLIHEVEIGWYAELFRSELGSPGVQELTKGTTSRTKACCDGLALAAKLWPGVEVAFNGDHIESFDKNDRELCRIVLFEAVRELADVHGVCDIVRTLTNLCVNDAGFGELKLRNTCGRQAEVLSAALLELISLEKQH